MSRGQNENVEARTSQPKMMMNGCGLGLVRMRCSEETLRPPGCLISSDRKRPCSDLGGLRHRRSMIAPGNVNLWVKS